MKVLLTGGSGYIGSHTAVELIAAGHEPVIVDDLSNSKRSVLDRLREITGQSIEFYEMDVADEKAMLDLCKSRGFDAAVHFAGLKAVGESVADPLRYYDVNLRTSLSLLKALRGSGTGNLVFSSSATVYGEPDTMPISESTPVTLAANPYGQTKIMIEQMLGHFAAAAPDFNIARLRYFNPAGAHPGGRIGEDPQGVPNNLVPFLTQVAIGKRQELIINGGDYDTPDGTCIRDYIHVQDLAQGHVAALERLTTDCGLVTYNLGTGRGYSVKEVVAAFEQATQRLLPKRMGPRRAGDIPASWADPSLAEKELGWKARLGIEEICRDAWNWQQKNPEGYE